MHSMASCTWIPTTILQIIAGILLELPVVNIPGVNTSDSKGKPAAQPVQGIGFALPHKWKYHY